MDMLVSGFGKRTRWVLLELIAVALLSSLQLQAGDEFYEDDFVMVDECGECLNCNLYWHGNEGCVTSRLPRWYAGADVLVLRRDIDQEVAFATRPAPVAGDPPIVHLGTSSFKDEFDTGIRFFAGYAINDWCRIEGLYYGSYDFFGDMAVTGIFDSPFGAGVTSPRIRFASELDNFEVNLRSRWSECPGPLQASLLVGGRYVNLDEMFSYRSLAGPVTAVDVETENELFGIQVGLMAQWQCHPNSWLDYELKGAMYTNRASYRSTSDVGPAQASARDVAAFSVDMSLILNYQLTQALALRFGYNAIWLGGVALGAQNVQTDINLLVNGPAKLDHSGLVVYHGPSFGVVVAW